MPVIRDGISRLRGGPDGYAYFIELNNHKNHGTRTHCHLRGKPKAKTDFGEGRTKN